ncbi:tryptophan--tRNA ligase [Sedimentibacter sp. zth1]|uniref:tryptophan--tRNA ligase n=1 Tax=Sedimentibacter sp. zth1 TaxID=2816908 RepID=UPI001A90DA0E|nr:tryptophan--tRNA ligase [Sedimentibacter sp. zth1]QSX07301.1 tryptophan--tRNA ligase [Sedimentibacter sp. zth1]
MKLEKKRILTGDRPTGKLHLGHFVGSLQNRVLLQDEYETFILIADIQALTTHFQNPKLINDSIYQVTMDNLAVGLDPDKVTFVQQSQIPSIAELTIFYSMFVSVNSLRHNPTIKTEAKQYGYDDLTYGFLGYPVSQTADITFCNADLVPVGDDQLPHMEQARKITRRFNELYGNGETIIKVPETLLSKNSRLAGLDGNSKMGKSLGNAIYLSDDSKTIDKKVKAALTDKNRIALTDKGNPNICMVSQYHKVFNEEEYENTCEMCRSANIGCVACKKLLAKKLNNTLEPIRERRNYYENNLNLVKEIIIEGTKKANLIGNKQVEAIKEAMKIIL